MTTARRFWITRLDDADEPTGDRLEVTDPRTFDRTVVASASFTFSLTFSKWTPLYRLPIFDPVTRAALEVQADVRHRRLLADHRRRRCG